MTFPAGKKFLIIDPDENGINKQGLTSKLPVLLSNPLKLAMALRTSE
jgi:hypothetical protein